MHDFLKFRIKQLSNLVKFKFKKSKNIDVNMCACACMLVCVCGRAFARTHVCSLALAAQSPGAATFKYQFIQLGPRYCFLKIILHYTEPTSLEEWLIPRLEPRKYKLNLDHLLYRKVS